MDQSTLPALVAHWAETCPDKVWMRDLKEEGSEDYTWAEANAEINAMAAMLEDPAGERTINANVALAGGTCCCDLPAGARMRTAVDPAGPRPPTTRGARRSRRAAGARPSGWTARSRRGSR